jgi:hypothetical protein
MANGTPYVLPMDRNDLPEEKTNRWSELIHMNDHIDQDNVTLVEDVFPSHRGQDLKYMSKGTKVDLIKSLFRSRKGSRNPPLVTESLTEKIHESGLHPVGSPIDDMQVRKDTNVVTDGKSEGIHTHTRQVLTVRTHKDNPKVSIYAQLRKRRSANADMVSYSVS